LADVHQHQYCSNNRLLTGTDTDKLGLHPAMAKRSTLVVARIKASKVAAINITAYQLYTASETSALLVHVGYLEQFIKSNQIFAQIHHINIHVGSSKSLNIRQGNENIKRLLKTFLNFLLVFITCRYASVGYAVVVCLYFYPSVTCWYCVKMA